MTLVAQRWNNPCMDEPPELQYNGHWRMAVWALRVGTSAGRRHRGPHPRCRRSTRWVLAVG